jgi:hypothetical protein
MPPKRKLTRGTDTVSRPKEALLEGVKILERVLLPRGFEFQFGQEGRGSGGEFARGEFVRNDRRLELHFRWTLGHVYYHAGNCGVAHGYYMKELGVLEQCKYPGFSEDWRDGFLDLAHDLSFAEDFLDGPATVLCQAAWKQFADNTKRSAEMEAAWSGDTRLLEEIHREFWKGHYAKVVVLASELRQPDLLTAVQLKIIAMAQKRA